MTDEVEFVGECPSCGMAFVGMTPEEFRLEMAYAFGEGLDAIEHLGRVTGWQEADDE